MEKCGRSYIFEERVGLDNKKFLGDGLVHLGNIL